MRIVIRREDYSASRYNLVIGGDALSFSGERDAFSLPYRSIMDFVVTRDTRGKPFFTMLCAGKHEGQITEPEEIEPFTRALTEKLGGTINIEVKKG